MSLNKLDQLLELQGMYYYDTLTSDEMKELQSLKEYYKAVVENEFKLRSVLDEINELIVSVKLNDSGKPEIIITTNDYGKSEQLLKLLAKHEDKK